MRQLDYTLLPPHIQESMKLYIERGIYPGGFLTACLGNKLVESFLKADDINIKSMENIAAWIYTICPIKARGSWEKVQEWIILGGTKGIEAKRRLRTCSRCHGFFEEDLLKFQGAKVCEDCWNFLESAE